MSLNKYQYTSGTFVSSTLISLRWMWKKTYEENPFKLHDKRQLYRKTKRDVY